MPGDGEHDARAVVTAFLAAMIWGYGTTGYGPYRTSRVLASDPDIVKHLIDVASRAQGSPNGGEDAFRHIAEHRGQADYLKYLGPAFGTKFLYFLTAASEVADTTPVMDAVVRRWFRSEADISLATGSWDTESYQTYIGCLDEWREQMPTGRGGNRLERVDLELLIFASARGDDITWELPNEYPTVDELLDLLQPDVDSLAEKSGSLEGPELLRRLSDWVAERAIAK